MNATIEIDPTALYATAVVATHNESVARTEGILTGAQVRGSLDTFRGKAGFGEPAQFGNVITVCFESEGLVMVWTYTAN